MRSPTHYIPERYRRYLPAAAFILGVLFDVFTLGRIDSLRNIVKQGICLAIVGWLVLLELAEADADPKARLSHGPAASPTRGISARLHPYRESATHFLLGVLLSAHTVFYFKSASFLSSSGFLLVMAALLIANERHEFRRYGIAIRMAIFALCLASYCISIVPIAIGFVGPAPVLLSLALSFAGCWALLLLASRRARSGKTRKVSAATGKLGQRGLLPVAAVHLALGLLYFARVLPPVPLSASYFGIFHKIEKSEGHYLLTTQRPAWRFWENGDQTFEARPGDAIYAYVRVFSPSGFRDRIQMRWLLDEARGGWQTQDVIPLVIQGGRADGYRGYTVKTHFSPGRWRIQVETSDEREIARLYLNVSPAPEDADAEPPVISVWQD